MRVLVCARPVIKEKEDKANRGIKRRVTIGRISALRSSFRAFWRRAGVLRPRDAGMTAAE